MLVDRPSLPCSDPLVHNGGQKGGRGGKEKAGDHQGEEKL